MIFSGVGISRADGVFHRGKIRNAQIAVQIFTARDRISQRQDKAGAQPEIALQLFSAMSFY